MAHHPVTFGRKTRAIAQLIRPELPLAAGICLVIGQVIALSAFPPFILAGLGFMMGFLVSSSQMIFNDYFDLEVDRINTPQRPLPSGLLTKTEVIILGSTTSLAGLVVALLISPLVFGLCLVTWVLGFLYNWKLKAAGFWGNLIVSTSVGMTILLGGISTGQPARPVLWIFSLIAFIFDLAEEIAGDAMDMEGDRERASRSLAILFGKRMALRVSASLFGVMVILTIFPLLLGEAGPVYLIPITLTNGLLIFFLFGLLRSTTPEKGRKAMRGLYISATLGLVAFVAGMLLV